VAIGPCRLESEGVGVKNGGCRVPLAGNSWNFNSQLKLHRAEQIPLKGGRWGRVQPRLHTPSSPIY
jgi:hypothetical protein